MDTKTMEKDNPTTHSFFGVVLCGRLLELPTCQFLNLCWIQLIPLHLQKSKHSNVNFNYYGNSLSFFSSITGLYFGPAPSASTSHTPTWVFNESSCRRNPKTSLPQTRQQLARGGWGRKHRFFLNYSDLNVCPSPLCSITDDSAGSLPGFCLAWSASPQSQLWLSYPWRDPWCHCFSGGSKQRSPRNILRHVQPQKKIDLWHPTKVVVIYCSILLGGCCRTDLFV